jgi:hypothetical protein
MKVTRIVLERGITYGSKDGPWKKEIVTVEANLDECDNSDAVYRELQGRIDKWLADHKYQQTSGPNSLPWRPFKSGGKGGWMFSDSTGLEDLVKRLKASENKALIEGGWRYRLSGDDDIFVQCFPLVEGERDY